MLSQGGNLILIRHVLSNMDTHTLVILQVLLKAIQSINSILVTFFWNESNGTVKCKWRAWEKLCKSIEEGGIGVRKLTDINKSFLMKFA